MPSEILCPEGTIIKDYAYPESHPLHTSNYPSSQRSSISSTDESGLEDLESDDYLDKEEQSPEEINRKAVALFAFEPENDNEFALKEGQSIWISYRHGQGWLVAEDLESGESGLVPEGYVEICTEGEEPEPEYPQEEVAERFETRLSQSFKTAADDDSEWEDTDSEDSVHESSAPVEDSTDSRMLQEGLERTKIQ